MQKIIPHMWFDNQAEEAVKYYVSVFKDSKVGDVARYGEEGAKVSGKPKGTVMTVAFKLEGQDFMALNGGPEFAFSPAISFFVNCETHQEIDELWARLSEGGAVLMEMAEYPFSKRFGWLKDRYGVSWQLNLAARKQKITPFLMFVGKQHGRAEEAMRLYVSLFENSSIVSLDRYGAGEGRAEGTVRHATFTLDGQEFMAIDGLGEHPFTFTPAISIFVDCRTQEEVDRLWEKLSDGGEIMQCGWLNDRFGVSWQIVPSVLRELLQDKDAEKSERVMTALIQMKKIEIEGLKRAYGRSV